MAMQHDRPGLGVELEISPINIVGSVQFTSGRQLLPIKGKKMIPAVVAREQGPNWEITTEIGSDNPVLFPEVIVNGKTNFLGTGSTKAAGASINAYFKAWAPVAGQEITIQGGDQGLGPFRINEPTQKKLDDELAAARKKNPEAEREYTFSAQVTTAMPLGAIYELLIDAKTNTDLNKPRNALTADQWHRKFRYHVVTKESFANFNKIPKDRIDDEFLGFFNLLAAYCTTGPSDPKDGPKRLCPIMPRTNFVTMFNTFKIADRLKAQFAAGTTLYDIVMKVAKPEAKLDDQIFWWNTLEIVPQVPEIWDGEHEDLKSGKLSIGKFLDYLEGYRRTIKAPVQQLDLLSIMDRELRHGQIGGYAQRLETVSGTNIPAPIFEFRDLGATESDLESVLVKYENAVLEFHRKYTPTLNQTVGTNKGVAQRT